MKIRSLAITIALLFATAPGGFAVAQEDPDADSDSILDSQDNCRLTPNTDQRDEDLDGIGTACDCDFGNDGFVLGDDVVEQFQHFGSLDGLYDITGDGFVLGDDVEICANRFNSLAGDL